MDDGPEVRFDREFLGNPIIIEEDPGRLRDLLSEDEEEEDPYAVEELVLPTPRD